MQEDLSRLIAVINIPMMLLICAPLWFLFASRSRRKQRDSTRGDYAGMVHIGSMTILLVICFVYFVMPLYFESDDDWAGLVNLDAGAMLLALTFALYRNGRTEPTAHRKYMGFRLCALVLSGTGLLVSGLMWLFYMPEGLPFRSISLVAALLSLVIGESVFLVRNKWRLVPHDLR